MKHFSKFNLSQEELEQLENYQSRDGFVRIEEPDFTDMIEYFEQYRVYRHLLPILTDHNSNYWCYYTGGPLKGMVCYLSPNELDLAPKFKGLSELMQAIEENLDAYDFEELDPAVFDFPSLEQPGDWEKQAETIAQLFSELDLEEQEDVRQQLAYSIMVLTPYSKIEALIYPFLEEEDMYIQERAIQLLGIHKYRPAKSKLIELTKTALPNGRKAAGKALKALR